MRDEKSGQLTELLESLDGPNELLDAFETCWEYLSKRQREDFLSSYLQTAHDEGYQEGYETGDSDGYDRGNRDAKEDARG